MCGIAGVYSYDRPGARVDPGVLAAMADTLVHRGPDDEGFHLSGNLGLAHRRLSIIDLGGGHQPMTNEDGSVVVAYNGEIYNYRDLTHGLEARGHRFRTRSDTEVLVHGYEERGADWVEELRGMFAYAVWDEARRRLVLVRDRLGIKPLYYHAGREGLVFASEIKALLEHPGVPRELDPEALDAYLSLRYVPGPRTPFRGIRKLPPGHLLVCDRDGPRERRYWDVPGGPPSEMPDAELERRFAELLEESVRLRLMADVPLGVFLSGGLDSTSILALMTRAQGGEPARSFTVGYDGPSPEDRRANELDYARMAARAFGADHHELALTDADFEAFLPQMAWYLDEPMADPTCVPLYLVSRLARRHATVVLSGEGADEVLAGYGVYRRMLAFERLYRSLGRFLKPLSPAVGLLPGERLRHGARLATRPLAERYRGVSRAFLPEGKARLLGGAASAGGEDGVGELFGSHHGAAPGTTPLDRMLYVDAKTWLPDELLLKADRMTMASSQELRVPFLDHRLVELAATLPPRLKVGGGAGKVVLRRAMAGVVPRPILERSKRGFPVPTVPLLRRLHGFTRDLLLDPGSACRSWFDSGEVERLLAEHESGRVSRDQEIWSLLVLELWHGVFLDGRLAPARRPRRERPPVPALAAGGQATESVG